MATGKRKQPKTQEQAAVDTAYFNSDSGPALPPATESKHPALKQARAVGDLVDSLPENATTAAEYGAASAAPLAGQTSTPADESASESTLSEKNKSRKTGAKAAAGVNAADGGLPRVRADNSGQAMTTNQGVPVADNQSSLKAGLRGP